MKTEQFFYLCWHQVDENWTILICADQVDQNNYSNLCWHQVDQNWTIRTCADTKWMKTELFEPVLTPSEWKPN